MAYRLPNDTQHIALIGRNGSGKTQAALWHLSRRRFDLMPVTIVDFKRDEHIAGIEAYEIPVGEAPTEPGIFVVRPDTSPESMALLAQTLDKIYHLENQGIWFDEAFMLGSHKDVETVFERLLMQGRSKRIPMIILVQRPVWVSRFVFSESSFFQLFHLQDKRDVATVAAVVPERAFIRLPDFHSAYYDVGRDQVDFLAPVPSETEILTRINSRLIELRNRQRSDERERNRPRML